jgi:hypothetical protein
LQNFQGRRGFDWPLDLDLVVVVACGRHELQEASDLDPSVVDARVLSGAAGLDLARWISIRRSRTHASAERRRVAKRRRRPATRGGGAHRRDPNLGFLATD